jgi:hypothetical protein
MTFDIAGVKKTAELKTGDKIMVSYTEKDGKMVAKDIFVTTGNGPGAQKATVGFGEGWSKAEPGPAPAPAWRAPVK